jgi:hypothetical protein
MTSTKLTYKLIQSCNDLQEWIIESEMEGLLDKEDSFYPIYKNLGELRSKLENEELKNAKGQST